MSNALSPGIQQTAVDEATDKWRRRFSACVHAERRHFEHLLYNECNMSSLNIFMLNGQIFSDFM